MQTALYSTIDDISRAQQEAGNGVTMGLVLTLRVSGSSDTFHVLVQDVDYQRFMALQARSPLTPSTAPRVGIQANYCPATPGQLIEPAVFDLTTGAEAGNVGGPDPAATYMAVSQTEAVVVPPEVDPWIRAFADGQQALSRRADMLPAAATILCSKGFPEEQIRHALAGDGQELHSMLE